TLVEVEEEAAEVPVAVGSSASAAVGGRAVGAVSQRTMTISATSTTTGPAVISDEPGPTTGLHVPRRTHRRIAPAAKPYRQPWSNPILWRELMTRAYGARPLIIKGCYILLYALGMGLFFHLARGLENPLGTGLGLIPIGLTILSLILVNAQGVTA